MARRSRRKAIIDWWQVVLDETKDLVDSGIDRCRRDDEEPGDDIEVLKEAVAGLDAKLDRLAHALATKAAPGKDVDSMTKAELQALADERGIEGVDRTSQTRDEMLRRIRPAVAPLERQQR